ncbi:MULTISPECIES: CopG family transcriptional regulator [unclassified Sphingopyxis]|uniref:CopG family transcriptional regulator n=1 Tax=unclassified Sphingopyxis TaxID=2614943 RepID=UPI00285CB933|nr:MULTISPECIES: CopG family transcriptional regulator [unclassified Sphingopyxis]MDR6833923.1 putative transcriptional regulator [Sphingopyxis sp. BE122]MDR7226192.1 putative transcriptional regulator [Sphingopyxis sp. BE259]
MRKSSVKRTFRIDSVLARQLDERASSRRITRTDIVEAALASLLTPDHEERLEAVLTRRLDRLSRQLDRLEWHVELSNETLALFVRSWLINNSPLPDTALRAAQVTGKKRWEAFVDSLSRRMELGPKLGDELSRDVDGDHSSPAAK